MARIDSRIPLRLDARDLRLVAALAEAGSLTRAAARLNLSQSTLSHHLADLEARVGGRLFARAARGVEATALGRRFRAGAQPLVEGLRELERGLVLEDAPAPPVELRVATECYTTYPWLGRVAREFGATHPGVRLRVVPQATARPLAALLEGGLDLALVTRAPRERGLLSTFLFEDELVALVAADHAWASRRRVEPADFRDATLLVYAREPADSSFVAGSLRRAGVVPREVVGLPHTEALVELARAGLGVAVLARWAAEAAPRRAGLRALRIGREGGERRRWQAARRRAHPEAVRLDALSALIRKRWAG
jgi:LysR family transcriptional regulator for metE and metH